MSPSRLLVAALVGTAERALARGRHDLALRRLERAWSRLSRVPDGQASLRKLQARSLAGLGLAHDALGHPRQAVECCRAARRLGLEIPQLTELACRHALALRDPEEEAIDDLIAWACREPSSPSEIPSPAVAAQLRRWLDPRRRPPAADLAGRLERLAGVGSFSWVSLYRAELARQRSDWEAAATLLEAVVHDAGETAARARLLWQRARCLQRAGDRREARRCCTEAWQAGPPPDETSWLFFVRLLAETSPDDALEAAVAGLQARPESAELAELLLRLSLRTGKWERAFALSGEFLGRDPAPAGWEPLARLQCLVARHLRDGDLALRCARLIDDRQARGRPVADQERRFALAVTALADPAGKPTGSLGGAAGASAPEPDPHLAVLRLWRAHRHRDWPLAADEARRLFAAGGETALGPAWSSLAQRCAVRAWLETGSEADLARLLGAARVGLSGPDLLWLAGSAFRREFHAVTQKALLACIRAGDGTPGALQAGALLSLRLAVRDQGRGDHRAAATYLLAALGLWACFLQDGLHLCRYAANRYKLYATPQPLPAVAELRELVDRLVSDFLPRFVPDGWQDGNVLQACWEMERAAAGLVAEGGGIPLPGSERTLACGPLLASLLGLGEEVRGFLVARRDRQAAEPGEGDVLRRLANLLDLPVEAGPSSRSAQELDHGRLRRLFSPLGPGSTLMAHHQFEAAVQRLAGLSLADGDGVDPGSRALRELLGRLVDPTESGKLEREAREMILECRLQEARTCVAQVPLDLEAARGSWEVALEVGRKMGEEEAAARCLSEIAIGRADMLFRIRSRQEISRDAVDRRGNAARQREAVDLLRLAWRVCPHVRVQGPLSERLNQLAVMHADKERFEPAIALLREAHEVKRVSPYVLNNLVGIVLGRLSRTYEQHPRSAAQKVLEITRWLKAQASGGDDQARKALQEIEAKAFIPYYNAALKAWKEQHHLRAAELLEPCLLLDGGDKDVRWLREAVRAGLRKRCDEDGEEDGARAREMLARLGGEDAGDAEGMKLARQVDQLAASGPEALRLNQQAVAAANEGRFAEAIKLIDRALEIDGQAEVLRRNRTNILMAWLASELKKSGPSALSKNRELWESMRK